MCGHRKGIPRHVVAREFPRSGEVVDLLECGHRVEIPHRLIADEFRRKKWRRCGLCYVRARALRDLLLLPGLLGDGRPASHGRAPLRLVVVRRPGPNGRLVDHLACDHRVPTHRSEFTGTYRMSARRKCLECYAIEIEAKTIRHWSEYQDPLKYAEIVETAAGQVPA